MNTRPTSYTSSSISLPSINSMDFNQGQRMYNSPNDLSSQMEPSSRSLLPPPQHYSMQGIPQPEYVTTARPSYHTSPSPYGYNTSRLPLPPSVDQNMGIAPGRTPPKAKEVKRRTKTGCMTCRKRRIKANINQFEIPMTDHHTYAMSASNAGMRSIEDICSVNGHRSQPVPPLPASSAPNFGEIQKVYNTFFASGLDQFLETGQTKWFELKGFALLAGDRSLLAQFMLYLTLISNTSNTTAAGPEQAALASQEARMVWSLLNLCVRPAQEGGDEEAEKLAHRVKAIEALLTGEPIVRAGSMSDFVHQEEPDQDVDMATAADSSSSLGQTTHDPLLAQQQGQGHLPEQQAPFQKQLTARSDSFWSLVTKAAEHPTNISIDLFEQTRQLLDGMENRDVMYSTMLLTSKASDTGSSTVGGSRPGTAGGPDSNNSSPNRAARRQEREQASRLLESEAGGKATNMVLQVLAGMALRAFQ